jgi:hypothetical protein
MEMKIKNEDDLNNYETTHSKRLQTLAYEELQKHTISKINNRADRLDFLYINIYKNEMLNDLRDILKVETDEENIKNNILSINNEIEKTKAEIKNLLIGLENIRNTIKLKWNIEATSKSTKTNKKTKSASEIIEKYNNIGK